MRVAVRRVLISVIALVGLAATVTALATVPDAGRPGDASKRGAAQSLVWADEFSGRAGKPPDHTKWGFDTGGGGWGNHELQSYTRRARNVRLDGKGHLAITARPETYTGNDGVTSEYTSGRINTQRKFEFAYGRVEARIRLPAGRGLWPAFWAIGGNFNRVGWPASGEIDVMEIRGDDPSQLFGTVHGPLEGSRDYFLRGERQASAPLSGGFHVYGVTWSPGRIAFSLDGRTYFAVRPGDRPPGSGWSFEHPFFLLLNLAVGGDWPGSPDETTHWPATMLVDWVRVWRRSATFCPVFEANRFKHRCPPRQLRRRGHAR